ncbi:aromatic/alkene monooxygenase hydroxylase subunit beta [Methylococcus capsulatus]|uniref:aromatic/alkene monooxygenase hydroxylase subunit beta n=1 Tax=Methylococcus capsulatus TaxID=414 RepID=UPI001C527599|nr:aromatic/alkene monooxygenase hydroxylase subunit beta [Methylococcus capsulatus]QXP88077.1 aromatic/alkene monooxygenase hydroxylase subunit beta [Methylococcus capsulatus]UQN13105.1 aromatic/alkene monooxygenase hydroxylase subunit beta [Methylococcus capsulatus]
MSMLGERRRGLTDPEMAAVILKALPEAPLDGNNKMGYFVTPRWKRLTEYEALTVYAQPNADWIAGGLDWGDWTQKFHGGRPSWGNETTELRTVDWFKHRDPLRRWHAPYVKDKAEEWRYTDRFLQGYSADGQIRAMNPTWRDEFINRYWGAFLFNEYGLFNAHSQGAREALSDVTRVSLAFWGFDKIDIAQMIQLERGFLAKIVPGFDESTTVPKAEWTNGEVYKSARLAVEGLWQEVFDWNESAFSVHAVYDALFGQFVRREFFQRLAPRFGDNLTPFFINQAQTYFQIAKQGVQDLYYNCLGDDPEFSDYNRTVMRNWTGKWLEPTIAALRDFMGLFAKLPAGTTDKEEITASLYRVVDDWIEDYASRIDFKADRDQIVKAVLAGLK